MGISESVVEKKVRPFARAAQPFQRDLGAASKDLAAAGPDLTTSFRGLNRLFNIGAYNPGWITVRDAVKKKLPKEAPKPGKFRLSEAATAEAPAAAAPAEKEGA